jgi:hypothetical protein
MSIKIPFVRKKMSTLLALSIAILMLMATSPVLLPPLSNFLLQPVQAQTAMRFYTPNPVDGHAEGAQPATITFDAKATNSSTSGHLRWTGTWEITIVGNPSDGLITFGDFSSSSEGGHIQLQGQQSLSGALPPGSVTIDADCSKSGSLEGITAELTIYAQGFGSQPQELDFNLGFNGVVECSLGGGNTTTDATPSSPSQMTGTTTTTQDSDSDGIPDSSDNCPHNSHHRCYKEGGSSSGTTHDQQPSSSSSNGNGNQTG